MGFSFSTILENPVVFPSPAMDPVPRLSLVDQTALHLQRGIEDGRWQGFLPGVGRLAAELGISKDTTEAALALLETRGCIHSHGRGKRREVVTQSTTKKKAIRQSLRIGLLLRDDLDKSVTLTQQIFLKLVHDLEALGHVPLHAPKSQDTLGHDPARIGRMIEKCKADAWIISGASVALQDWLHKREKPFLLLGGSKSDYPYASAAMDSNQAIHDTVERLIGLGHKRIVMICLPDWVRPVPGPIARNFLAQLSAASLPASDYNVPYHETTPEGFGKLLDSLFQLTPPTALIVPHMHYALAIMTFANARGLRIPQDLSLIVRMPDPAFEWTRPRIAHFDCPTDALIRHILRWVECCAKGIPNYESKIVQATLIPGETMISPPK